MSAIKLISQQFYKELSTAPVNFLLGNVGDKIRVETVFTIENSIIASSGSPFTINNNDGYIGSGWLTDEEFRFVDFKVGDYVYYYNYAVNLPVDTGNFYIIDKKDNGAIRLNTVADGSGAAPTSPTGTNDTQGVLSNQTPITAVKYHYNFIENSSGVTYVSPVDGSEQLFVRESKLASDNIVDNMKANGPLTWQNGSATIAGVPGSSGIIGGVYKSTYKIIHHTKIPPFVLFDQLQNEADGIAPSDFQKTKCLKFVSFIEAAINYTDPNFLVSEDFDGILGNVGYYGENFNTGKTNYSITNVVYKKSGATVDSIILDSSETVVTFNVENATDTPFSNNNTKFVLGIQKVPADPAEYQNNNKLLDENFLFDRALQTVGSAAVNGDNYATDLKFLTDIKGEFVSTSKIKITAKINMASDVIEGFSESSLPQYLLFISVQNHTLATGAALNDLVTLKVDMAEFSVQSTDKTMIIASNKFIRHPEYDPAGEGVAIGFGANSIEVEEISTGASNAPGLMVINTIENKLYVVVGGNKVKSYNLATNALVNSLTIASGELKQLTFDSFNNRIYVSNGGNNNVKVIDCTTDTLLATITVGDFAYGAKFCPINNYVYVSNYNDGTVSIINTATNAVVATKTVGNNPGYIEYNSLQNEMYVSNEADNTISVIDCATDNVIATINVVDSSVWLTYNSINNTMYVHCSVLKIIDCGTKIVSSTTIAGVYQNSFSSFDPTYNQLYMADSGANALAVINCLSNEITYNQSFATNTICFLIDTVNEKLFISNANVSTGIIYVLKSSFDVFPEDEIVACSNFYIESAGRTTDEIKLTSLQAKVIASDGTNEFELDGFTIQLNSYPLVGYTQQFDAQVARGFHIPVGTLRKYIEVKRRNDLDTGTRKYFSSNYPFLWRWETWTKALGVDSSFFDSSLPNNGFNHWWFHYKAGDWKLYYKLIINATKNGDPQRYTLQNQIVPHDYNSNSDWTTKTIVTKDAETLASLVTGGTTYIDTTRDTLVVATWEKSSLPTNYHVAIRIEAWEAGGYLGERIYSSRWDWSSDTWFKSTDGSNKVELSIAGNIVTAKAIIDYTKLPKNVVSYKLSSRIYEGFSTGLATDDDVQITTDDGVFITID